jgi:hypothetical protein
MKNALKNIASAALRVKPLRTLRLNHFLPQSYAKKTQRIAERLNINILVSKQTLICFLTLNNTK